ncbi:agamous-like MADS-box protein AGL82, partial [Macadamia integrifolia]|uniref:agamous-like MADS-box protein AGL82 n=1 Tax=Macadamia integrifolia TaxID=60698 RepID=UPI001C4F44A3
MGRSKQKMELIRNEKLRTMTFQKRMKGFKKKMHEFSTLCDVKAYSVIFGPKQGKDPNGLVEPETWPENKNDVYDFFQQFQNYEQGKQEVGIAEFFMNQKKKVRAELNQLREQNDKANNYPTWNERLDQCSLDQLKTLSTELDLKLE